MGQTRRVASSSYLLQGALGLLLMLVAHRMVDGQGLDVGGDQLGAGAAATANEFETFEDALSLSLLGGRGRGGRGGSGNLGGFRDVTDYQQLQASYYYIGSSPPVYESSNKTQTPGIRSYVPSEPRDQQLCNSCVGQAVATAVQMSLAYTLQKDVREFEVSALDIYYCVSGGRSCLTGWDIQPALAQLEQNPQFLRQDNCTVKYILGGRNEAENNNWGSTCRAVADKSKNPTCKGITKEQPLYRCSYTSLSSFYQIQQHIRKHGAVVTRIAIPDDFNLQFNHTARFRSGLDLPAYQYNASAKTLYGHAAVIVGYNNNDFTWTLLNSWGSGNATGQTRLTGGVTADGLFKVQMGLLGIGTPEKSYGVSCEPAVGREGNLNGEQPWLRGNRWPVAEISSNETTCFEYRTRKDDSVSSVVDHFGLDIREFVRQNVVIFRNETIGGVANLTYKFAPTIAMRVEEITSVLNIATNVTDGLRNPDTKPFMECWHYATNGAETQVICDGLTDAENEECAKSGVVGCTLHYQDLNLTAVLPPNTKVKVCNRAWTDSFTEFQRVAKVTDSEKFKGLSISEEDAVVLQRLRRAFTVNGSKEISLENAELNCLAENSVVYAKIDTEAYKLEWGVYCADRINRTTGQSEKVVSAIYIGYLLGSDTKNFASFVPELTEDIGHMLLSLMDLTQIYIYVRNGTLPPQLGALPKLESLIINHFCLSGSLPPQWFPSLSSLKQLMVSPSTEAVGYVDPEGASCGLSGSIPETWFVKRSSITNLDLSGNALSGELPVQLGRNWRTIEYLNLRSNRISGKIPGSWSALSVLRTVDLGDNMLNGVFPLSWRELRGKLEKLSVDQNPLLKGCVPLTSYTQIIFNGTLMSGWCSSNGPEIERAQVKALRDLLPNLLYIQYLGENSAYLDAFTRVIEYITGQPGLGNVVSEGQSVAQLWVSPIGGFTARITIEVIDDAEYVTRLQLSDAALNTTALAPLLNELRKLRMFECNKCNKSSSINLPATDRILPENLPAAVPGLESLSIAGSELMGTLPKSWGRWRSIKEMDLSRNSLNGNLPGEWKGMAGLTTLNVERNRLNGKLPSEWGLPGTRLPSSLKMVVRSNFELDGTVPRSYGHFSTGSIDIRGTRTPDQICSPGGITVVIFNDTFQRDVAPQCFNNYTDVKQLSALKDYLTTTSNRGALLPTWDFSNITAGPGTPPSYCRWIGVGCDTSYYVSKLDLSVLGMQDAPLLNLNTLFEIFRPLKELKTLVLTGVNVRGRLTDAGIEGALGSLVKLQHLDLSHNPSIEDTLPAYISTLSSLQKLVISNTGISGTFPKEYALLQDLQEFRAASCSGLGGQLPVEYGLLYNLKVLEITGSGITGTLPPDWANSTALSTVRLAMLATAKQTATAAEKQLKEAQAQLADAVDVQPSSLSVQAASSPASAPVVPVLQAATNLKEAQQRAAGAKRVVQALQRSISTTRMAGVKSTGLGLFNLKELTISGNTQLNGPLPAIYSGLSQLEYVDLSSNELIGNLPAEWGTLKNLQVLNLASNNLRGTHPIQWSGMTNLQAVYLSGNNFDDSFPAAYWTWRKLAILQVSTPLPDISVWRRFAGNGYSIQCLLVEPRLTVSQQRELTTLSQSRDPPGDIEFADNNSELCDLAALLEQE